MGLLDNLFKPKRDQGGKKGVEKAVRTFPAESPKAPPTDVVAPPKPGAFLSPRSYVPRSSAQVVPPNRGAAPSERKTAAPAIAPEPPGAKIIVLTLGDVLARIPTQFLRAGTHDPKRELRFYMEDLSADIARGRAAVYLAHIVTQCPDIFVPEVEGFDDLQIRLPLQKLVEQIGLGAAPRAISGGKSLASEELNVAAAIALAQIEATSKAEPPSSSPPLEVPSPEPPAEPSPELPVEKVEEAAVQVSEEKAPAGEETIFLSLNAILRTCPAEIIIDRLPQVAEGVRIALPFPGIERQLASGKVEVSSVRFVSALPVKLLPFFQAKENVKVPLPLEEIFQNLPGNQPHLVSETETAPPVFATPPPVQVAVEAVGDSAVEFKPLPPVQVEIRATPPPPVDLKPATDFGTASLFPEPSEEQMNGKVEAPPAPETASIPEVETSSEVEKAAEEEQPAPQASSAELLEPVVEPARDEPSNAAPVTKEVDERGLAPESSSEPAVVLPPDAPEVAKEEGVILPPPGAWRAVLPTLRPPILLPAEPPLDISEVVPVPAAPEPDPVRVEPAQSSAPVTPPPAFQPPPDARLASSPPELREREPITAPGLALQPEAAVVSAAELEETTPILPGLIPRQSPPQFRPMVLAPPSIFSPSDSAHPAEAQTHEVPAVADETPRAEKFANDPPSTRDSFSPPGPMLVALSPVALAFTTGAEPLTSEEIALCSTESEPVSPEGFSEAGDSRETQIIDLEIAPPDTESLPTLDLSPSGLVPKSAPRPTGELETSLPSPDLSPKPILLGGALARLFLSNEELDLSHVSELLAALPGIRGTVLSTPSISVRGGQFPAAFDARSLPGAAQQMEAAMNLTATGSGLGALQHVTFHGSQHSLSLFIRGDICVGALHGARIFLPGVQEKFAAAAEELARHSSSSSEAAIATF